MRLLKKTCVTLLISSLMFAQFNSAFVLADEDSFDDEIFMTSFIEDEPTYEETESYSEPECTSEPISEPINDDVEQVSYESSDEEMDIIEKHDDEHQQLIIGADGEQLSEEEQQATLELLASIDPTTDYVVYAEQLSNGCNHIEGNIAVNEVIKTETSASELQIKTNMMEDGQDTQSFIGQVADGISVTTEDKKDVLVTGDTDAVNKVNNKGTLVDAESAILVGEDGETVVDKDTIISTMTDVLGEEEAKEFANEVQITKNLSNIEAAAEAASSVLNDVNGEMTNTEAVSAATKLLNSNSLTKDDIIVLNLSYEDLTGLSSAEEAWDEINRRHVQTLTNRLKQLLNANEHKMATVVINIDTTGASETGITIAQSIKASNQNQNGESNGYLIWNFGDYNGTVEFKGIISGVIVAPSATVKAYDTVEGRIIANYYDHVTGSETHTPKKYDKPKPTPPEEPEPTPTPTPTPVPEEPTPTPTPEPTPTPIPEEPTPTPTPVPNEPTPTPTPVPEKPEPTPTPTPTPVPEKPTPTPTPTPIPEEPTPTPTPIPEVPEPTPTPSPVPTPDEPPIVKPIPRPEKPKTPDIIIEEPRIEENVEINYTNITTNNEYVYIPPTPIPLAAAPSEPNVLGAKRPKVTTIGANNAPSVLGERRGPETGDEAKTGLYIGIIIFLLGVIIFTLIRKPKKYSEDTLNKVFY